MNPREVDGDDAHSGHELETGILARAREWTDVFPWLRLVRTLRAAGSPPLILLVAVTFALWQPLFVAMIARPDADAETGGQAASVLRPPIGSPIQIAGALGPYTRTLIPTSVFDSGSVRLEGASWGQAAAAIVWSLLVWMPAALLLLRQGALLTCGRPMQGLRRGLLDAVGQLPTAWLIATVPLACVLMMAVMIAVTGWIGGVAYPVAWFEAILAVLVILVAIPGGVLIFGANVAVPLGWAAAANERDRDALDSLSRGYEYLMRRPLHLAWYMLISLVLLTVVGWLASAIAAASGQLSDAALTLAGTSLTLKRAVLSILGYFPIIVLLTLFWNLIGGVYLLLRFDAGGQEPEDLWLPTRDRNPSLPQRDA